MSAAAVERELWLGLYRRMRLIRGFEDLVQALFVKGHVHGTTHLYSGQEAVAVGVAGVLSDGDRAAGTYRGHGHALVLGTDPHALLDELLGRETRVCGGRAGSMNVVDLEHGLIGCFGIVGGSIAAATGAAFTLRRREGVGVAFFGDGAVNQAYFYGRLNFAKVFALPADYVCENGVYGEYTASVAVTAGSILARAEVMELPSCQADGNDVRAVPAAAQWAVDAARGGGGSRFIEALTYRFVGHSRSDPGRYRPEGELDGLERFVEEELREVEAAALAAPFPEPTSFGSEFKEAV